MFGLFMRKSFYDFMDHLYAIGLLNLGLVVSLLVPAAVPMLMPLPAAAGVGVLVAGIAWLCVYAVAAARMVARISDRSGFGFADFFSALKPSVRPGLALAAFVLVIVYLASAAVPFYLASKTLPGLLAAATVFWSAMLALLAAQYFPAAVARGDGSLVGAVRQCSMVFFDNTIFSIMVAVLSLPLAALSILLAFVLPGPAGILLMYDEAYRLRCMKYAWLREHPDSNRKHLPWQEILAEEDEQTGKRSLRGILFPWKD